MKRYGDDWSERYAERLRGGEVKRGDLHDYRPTCHGAKDCAEPLHRAIVNAREAVPTSVMIRRMARVLDDLDIHGTEPRANIMATALGFDVDDHPATETARERRAARLRWSPDKTDTNAETGAK